MRIELEISDESEEAMRIVDAVNSGRATAHAKKPEEFKEAFENAHRLTAMVSEEVMTKLVAALRRD